MSRIFDALKRAERPLDSSNTETSSAASKATERRRSPRWNAHVPVFVYGYTPNRQPFHETAYSTNVSAMGARLVMAATVRPGQNLLLVNKITQAEQDCRIAYVAGRDSQTVEVAVEFARLSPDFWRITGTLRRTKTGNSPLTKRRAK